MLRVIAVFGASTCYLASEPLDYDNRYWEPRIANTFELNRQFEISEKSGNRIRSMELTLDNRDQYFNAIEAASGFLNMKVTFLFKEGTKNYQKFTGRVNKLNSFGDEISLTVMESGYEYLKSRIPDAQIAYDYYSTNGLNQSWNAIPIPFGTVDRIPLSWVNLFRSEFIIGSGPLYLIRKLYFDKTLVYDVATGKNGYKPTPESEEIKFRIFHGIGSDGFPEIVEGVTSEYPGFAYIQLYKIVDEVEEPVDPITPDGEVSQIYADIYGIKNALGTGAERNPAQILYNLMTKPTTGYEGYGLGLDTDDIDFAAAIAECTTQGFLLDGVIDNTAEFGEWLNEILRCCRGSIIEEDGKIKLIIDAAKTASSIEFDETGVDGLNCDVSAWEEPDIDSQTNRVRLSYSWNFERGDFNKKPGVHEESPILDPNLKDTAHATRINKWNTETLEFKLIKDDATAHKLAQYYLKNITKQLKRTSLVTEVNIGDLDAGEVIKVNSPKFGWTQKEFLITGIKRTQEQTTIEIKEYSDDVYVFTDPGTGVEDGGQPYSIYNIPKKPILNSFTVVNEVLKDGSIQTRIEVEFTKADSNVQMTALYYRLDGEPDNTFKALDFTIGESTLSAIWKGIESGDYIFRLVSISPVGIYSDIDIEDGDEHYYGHPGVETVVSLEGDEVAPGTPEITSIQPILAGVSMYFDIPDGIPDDFSHFEVWRKFGEGEFEQFDENHPGQLFNDISYSQYLERQYAIIAVDTTGNKSELSAPSAAVTPLQIDTDDLLPGSVTSEIITDEQIFGKDLRTSYDVGPEVDGILFNQINGIQAWHEGIVTFELNPFSGTAYILGGNIETNYLVGASTNGLRFSIDGFETWNDGLRTFNINGVTGETDIIRGSVGGWSLREDAIYSDGIKLIKDHLVADANFVFGVGGWGAVTNGYFEAHDTLIRGDLVGVNVKKNNISSISGEIVLNPSSTVDNISLYNPPFSQEDYNEYNMYDIFQNYLYQIAWMTNTDLFDASYETMTYSEFVEEDKSYYYLLLEILGEEYYEDMSDSTTAHIFLKNNITSFAQGDLIRVKNNNLEFWGLVDEIVADENYGDYLSVSIKNGDKYHLTSGQVVVNYGNFAHDGGVLFDGSTKNISVFTHDGQPWTSVTNHVVIGLLNGWGSYTTEYGITIGQPNGHYLKYDDVSKQLTTRGNSFGTFTGEANIDSGIVGDLQVENGIINSQYSSGDNYYQMIIQSNSPKLHMIHRFNIECYECNVECFTGITEASNEILLDPTRNGDMRTNAPVEILVSNMYYTSLYTFGNIYSHGGFVTGNHLFVGHFDGSIQELAPLQLSMQNDDDYAIVTNGVIVSSNIKAMVECIENLQTRLQTIEGILSI